MTHIWVVYKPTLRDTIRQQASDFVRESLNFISLDETPPHDIPPGLIISVGGDGTFLTAARYAHKHRCPIMGFHAGTLGFLAAWDTNIPFFLDRAVEQWLTAYVEEQRFNDLFDVSERRLVRCQIGHQHWIALNEWTISPTDADRIVMYDAYVGHGSAEHYAGQHKANGVIVASATGSTAYTLSVNGALMDPEGSSMLQLAPIAPISMTSRPIIIGDNAHIDIVVQASQERPVRVKGDGQMAQELFHNTRISFMSHQRPVTVLQPKNTNWYNALTEKLHWNVPENNRIREDE